jgi:putative cell wall binding repeat 2
MKTKFGKLMGKLLFLCALLCLWGSSIAYAEEKVLEEKGLDSIIIHSFKDDELLANSPFRLFRFEGHIPTVVFGGRTDEQGEYSFRDFRANSEYIIMMENPKLKFDKDSVSFHTDESGKVVTINGKAVQSLKDGEIAFRGYEKHSDKLVTTEVEFYVVDAKTQTPVQDVELTANTLVPRLSSYQNAKSDNTGRVVFHLEGQEGGKIYSVCVSKNAQFMWKFEPEQITIHVNEKGEFFTEGEVNPLFLVTKEDRSYLRAELEGKIAEAKKYLVENTFSKEDSRKKLEQAVAAAQEELNKPETIPFYVESFIHSIEEAKADLEKYAVKEEKKQEDKKQEDKKPEEKEEEKKTEVKPEKQEVNPEKQKVKPAGAGRSERRSYRSSYTTVQTQNPTQKLLVNPGEWLMDSKGWWFKRADGSYPKTEWLENKGKWYFFDQEGYMKKGWVLWKEKWYYLSRNGDMLVDTMTPDGYKVDKDGGYVA